MAAYLSGAWKMGQPNLSRLTFYTRYATFYKSLADI